MSSRRTGSDKKSRRWASDFLESEAGNSLLALVSRGNAIAAELQRLGQSIPDCFKPSEATAKSRFAPVIFGLEYLTTSESAERTIESDERLWEIDEEFQELYQPILTRIFLLLQSIVNYYEDLNTFVQDVGEGK